MLDKVCNSLTQNPNSFRPRFAAFADEMAEDISAADWANRMRDRLGLAHLLPTGRFPAFPVALMRYFASSMIVPI